MKVSVELSWLLAQFVAQLFGGQLDHPEAIALALDQLSDAAWDEAEGPDAEGDEACPDKTHQDN